MHRLAWQFGCTVGELTNRITIGEFEQWKRYLAANPPLEELLKDIATASGIPLPAYEERLLTEEDWNRLEERRAYARVQEFINRQQRKGLQ